MKNTSFYAALLMSVLTIWVASACKSDQNKSTQDTTVTMPSPDEPYAPSEADIDAITYNYMEDDDVLPTEEAKTTPAKLKAKSTPVVYNLSEIDRPPLFSKECLTEKNPERCSKRALADWASENVDYPEADLAEGSDGLEYVTFVINKKGEVTTVRRVESKIEACEGCSQAVLDAVETMPAWEPAMLNGKPVNVVVTLPVRFKVL